MRCYISGSDSGGTSRRIFGWSEFAIALSLSLSVCTVRSVCAVYRSPLALVLFPSSVFRSNQCSVGVRLEPCLSLPLTLTTLYRTVCVFHTHTENDERALER